MRLRLKKQTPPPPQFLSLLNVSLKRQMDASGATKYEMLQTTQNTQSLFMFRKTGR